MKGSILTILIAILCVGVATGQDAILGTEAQRQAGKVIYDNKCAQCHGYNGDGTGVAKQYLTPQPRDFTSATFKFRTTQSGELPTHEDIKNSIRNGMPYTGMPAWKNFNDNDLSNLSYYIKTFSEDFKDYGDVQSINFPSSPSFSQTSAQRGRVVYEENQCLDCHGNLGRGDGKSAPTLKDQWDKPIRPADLTKRWTFRGGTKREDIYQTFTTGLDGSPMPSYSIQPPEDQWALVDYVYSLSRDESNYGTSVFAEGVETPLDISLGEALFENSEPALFPVVGQVIEPGRAFYPGVNAIEVKAIYNQDEIAILLSWHDMTSEKTGKNAPDIKAPIFNPDEDDQEGPFSDAVAIQIPTETPAGLERPYFLFGDSKNSVDIWFADLAQSEARLFIGKGSQALSEADSNDISLATHYGDGRWAVIFKRKRTADHGMQFDEGSFVPVSFSVWDGFNKERGNKRGVTSWYHIYLKPMKVESVAGPMAKYAMITFLLEIGIIFAVRRKYKSDQNMI